MAAGLGFKTFTTGEVLTAADTNGYLMQGINVFASTAARNAAITSPQEGQFAFTKDTNSLWYYDGAAWVASGATGDIEGVTAGVGITGGGTSGTVTVTNDMATTITAAGDIVVGTGSGTYDNLPIGTTAQILTADTTVSPYKVKWATPAAAASGLTLLHRSTFSNVATTGTTFDGYFTASYTAYLVIIEKFSALANDDPQLQMIYSGTTEASGYYGQSTGAGFGASTQLFQSTSNGAAFNFWSTIGVAQYSTMLSLTFTRVGGSSTEAQFAGTGFTGNNAEVYTTGCNASVARAYTGFLLKSSSSNVSGTATIYGLAIV